MNDRLLGWYPLVLLMILAALTMWLDRKVQAPQPPRQGIHRLRTVEGDDGDAIFDLGQNQRHHAFLIH